jgi:hypothetical protein
LLSKKSFERGRACVADGGEKIVRGAGADRVADMGVEAVS